MPTVDVTDVAYGAAGDGVADDTVPINDAIAALSAGDTLSFPAGTYLITDALVFDGVPDGCTVEGPGTIKIDASYAGTHETAAVAMHVDDATDLTFDGLVFDGNSDNNAALDMSFMRVLACTNLTVTGCTFQNCGHHAVWISGGVNTTFSSCEWVDGCEAAGGGNNSDVYASASGATYTFSSCTFTRTALAAPKQAFYMASGTGTYTDTVLNAPTRGFDFRAGTHTIDGATGTTGLAIITQTGSPIVHARNMTLDIYGVSAAYTQAIYCVTGTIIMSECAFTAKNAEAHRAWRIASGAGKCVCKRSTFTDFVTYGIDANGSAGGHVFYRNTFDGDGTFTGILSDSNTGTWFDVGNTYTDYSTLITNTDGNCKTISRWWEWRRQRIKWL